MSATVRQIKANRLHVQEAICSEDSIFLIGKNSRGNWVVQHQNGLCGGLFIGQAAALKFALTENGNHPEAVRVVPGVLELDIAASPRAAKRYEEVSTRLSSSRNGSASSLQQSNQRQRKQPRLPVCAKDPHPK
jgi:hypothetical protein